MFPELLDRPVYAIGIATAVFVAFASIIVLLRRDGHSTKQLIGFLVVLGAGSLLATKAASVLFRGTIGTIDQELSGGLRYPGSIMGLIAFGYLARKLLPTSLSLAQFSDLAIPGYMFACAIARLNCLVVGCCHGAICNWPWAIRFPRGSIPWNDQYEMGLIASTAMQSLSVHPFQLYLFFLELSVAGAAYWYQWYKRFDGEIFLLVLLTHGVLKSALEFLRSPYSVFHQSILVLSAGASIVLWSAYRSRANATALMP